MKFRLYTTWEHLSGSFWFLPAVMVIGAILLALGMTALDRANPEITTSALSWIYTGGPDGARSLLSTIAGSMISVAGVTFSITIVALSLASSQLGPRLLKNFIRDRGNQIVLGTFIAVFTYCLLVLRVIRSGDDVFVPHFSVTLAMLLAIASLGVLIYFFHHVSTIIQAQYVIANIGRDLEAGIARLFASPPENRRYEYQLRGEDDIPADFHDNTAFVTASASGYLQAIDYETLHRIARENDLLLHLLYRPGDFVARNNRIIAVYPADGLSEDVEKRLHNAHTLGASRLHIQDVEFAIDQLVEIALRALSPGINDPFTAIACLDQFSTTLSGLAERAIPSGYYYDAGGRLRMISDAVTFEGIICAAFDQIRQHSQSDVAVTIRMLEVIAIIVARTRTDTQREVLVQQAEMIKRASDETIFEVHDRQDIAKRYNLVVRVLEDGQEAASS